MTKTDVPEISYAKLWGLLSQSMQKVPKKRLDKQSGKMVPTDETILKPTSPDSLFKELGMSSQTLNAMKHQKNISLSVIDRLCAALNCQPSDIMELVIDFTPENNSI